MTMTSDYAMMACKLVNNHNLNADYVHGLSNKEVEELYNKRMKQQAYIQKQIGKMTENVYISNGYLNRKDYLLELAFAYDISFHTVTKLSNKLGHSNDFKTLREELTKLKKLVTTN